MKKVGFITSWMQAETEAPFENLETVKHIANAPEAEFLSPAHIEVKERTAFVMRIVCGKRFAKMQLEKKQEFLSELKWLVSLDVQLGG